MTDSSNHNDLEPREPAGTPSAANADTAETPATGRRVTRNKKLAIIGGAAAVIGLGAIAAPVVANTLDGHGKDHDDRQEQFEQDLAQKLGVPQSKVDSALKAMQGDRLEQRLGELQQSGAITADQAAGIKAKLSSGDVEGAMTELRAAMMTTHLTALVTAGTVTQAQADQITALVKAGVPVGLRVPPPGATGDMEQHVESAEHQQEQVQRLQEAGLITADQAKEINALITAKKTAEAKTAIHAAMDAGLLKQLVQDGKVTQAQADQITALQEAGVPIGIGGPGKGGPGGHHGMGGGHHGKGDGHHDGDHGMGGFDSAPPADGGQQSQDGGSQSGDFQPQTFGGDSA